MKLCTWQCTPQKVLSAYVGLGFRDLGFSDLGCRACRGLGFRGMCYSQRVLSTYMVEGRVSIIGVTIMVWAGIPHIGT